MRPARIRLVGASCLFLLSPLASPAGAGDLPSYAPDARALRQSYERADGLRKAYENRVFRAAVVPHWFDKGTKFWYRNEGRDGTRAFVLVDAAKGQRGPAFDHAKLAEALSKASKYTYFSDKPPFESISFTDSLKSLKFRAGGTSWVCDLDTYEVKKDDSPAGSGDDATQEDPTPPQQFGRGRGGAAGRPTVGMFGPIPPAPEPSRSPDGKWLADVREFNVVLRPAGEARRPGRDAPAVAKAQEPEEPLTHEGQADRPFDNLSWSPDSKTLVAYRVDPATSKELHLVQSTPREGGRARLITRPYDLPGDKFPTYELWLFDVASRKAIKPEVDVVDFQGPPRLHWLDGGARFNYEKVDRGHQRYRLIEANARNGKARTLIDERSDTFVNTYTNPYLRRLDESHEVLFKSERDGWAHLYLADTKSDGPPAQITKGEYVVRGVDRVDEETRQVWFRASGKNPGEDPYHVHHYRVDFDGKNLVALTEGDGDHSVQYSPDRTYLIDTYSRVDVPPTHNLRKASDGSLVCPLEKADLSVLEEAGWAAPEVFHDKGRDGKTDIWGVVYRPSKLDTGKSYPVIESIYAGPHDAHVPKRFQAYRPTQALAELGFIVVQIDGMGTAQRSKAFHDVCWQNLAEAGFPDRIPWIKALAAKYPYMDVNRVGVYGTSAGGQNAAGAVLFHPEFYKAAVAACGCHDNRMDKASWNEQWMGYPVGPHYAASSNITHAARLDGKLLLIVGELDTNVPPESTYRFADALIKAGKDFEFLTIPGAGHTDGGPYGERRRRDFFVRHLHHLEPPDRNVPATPAPETSASTAPPADRAVTRVSLATPAPRAATQAPHGGSPLGDLDPSQASMRDLIERYSADHGLLERGYRLNGAPSRISRVRAFERAWLDALPSVDFKALDQDGKVDYLLLKNHLNHELRDLDLEEKRAAETAAFLPFAATIQELADARRRMDWPDPEKAAGALVAVAEQIKAARKTFEKGDGKSDSPKVSPTLAVRAARSAQALRNTLKNWYEFFDGFDPLFSWWTAEPFKAADKAIADYATFLREKPGGLKPGDEDTIVGDPVGADALKAELDHAMIPYSAAQLVSIAEAEFAWCETEMKKAARDLGFGDDWKKALEHVKTRHVPPGQQPTLIRDLARESVKFLDDHDLVTIPPQAREGWRIEMMTAERQKFNPFFTGGEVISVAFPTSSMTHEQKLMSMRGNNAHFARATVHHELIPGHHLQLFSAERHKPYRRLFSTPFLVEGWPLYWETLLWDMDFAKSPEDRVGMLFWRSHRCARIIFSLKFHLGTMTAPECVDLLVDRVGHERENAAAEVRRSFAGGYGPLYQAAYMLGGLQLRALRKELVGPGKMTDRAFHDAVLRENAVPVEMIRARLGDHELKRDRATNWEFYGSVTGKSLEKSQ